MKKYIGLVVLLLIVAVLIGVYGKKLVNQSATVNKDQNQSQVNNQATEIENPSGSYSVNDLFTMNKPVKCSWKESKTDKAEVTNIIYISGKKFYQDVTMGDTGHAYTISNGDYLYIWNDFNAAASKMKFSEIKISPQPGQEKAQDTVGLDQKRDFVCENWSIDASLFNPPQDKNFKDITEEMQQATQELNEGGLENAKQQMCDLCRKAPSQELIDKCLENAQCSQ